MFQKLSAEKMSCGLDIGAQSIKACLVVKTDSGEYQLVGAYQNKSFGFKNGSVSDLNDFADGIYQAIHQLSAKTGYKIKDIVVGIDGALIEVRQSDTVIPLVERGSKVISPRDIKKINNQARILGMKMEEETLHNLPQSYEVDDVNSVLNPVGLYGRKLGIHTLTVVGNVSRLRNISKAVNQAGYDIECFCFSSYVAGSIALTEEELINGCIFIEIGAKKTNVFMYYEGVVRFFYQFDFGGDMLTLAIAEKINLPFDLAEEIKQSYGDVGDINFNRMEEILVKKESAYMPVNRKDIYDTISPVITKFLEELNARIAHSEYFVHMHHGFILSGGGSLLSGILERFEQKFHKPVRLAQSNIFTAKHSTQSVQFLPAVALAKDHLARNMKDSQKISGNDGFFGRLLNKFQEAYQDYF